MSAAPQPATEPLAARVSESVTVADPGRSLRGGSLRFARTVALSVGIQGRPPA